MDVKSDITFSLVWMCLELIFPCCSMNCGFKITSTIFGCSWSTTYEELLLSNRPFPEPIPLPVSLCPQRYTPSLIFITDFFSLQSESASITAHSSWWISHVTSFAGGCCRRWSTFWLIFGMIKDYSTRLTLRHSSREVENGLTVQSAEHFMTWYTIQFHVADSSIFI